MHSVLMNLQVTHRTPGPRIAAAIAVPIRSGNAPESRRTTRQVKSACPAPLKLVTHNGTAASYISDEPRSFARLHCFLNIFEFIFGFSVQVK